MGVIVGICASLRDGWVPLRSSLRSQARRSAEVEKSCTPPTAATVGRYRPAAPTRRSDPLPSCLYSLAGPWVTVAPFFTPRTAAIVGSRKRAEHNKDWIPLRLCHRDRVGPWGMEGLSSTPTTVGAVGHGRTGVRACRCFPSSPRSRAGCWC
jgi:hypothetical protein